MEGLSRKEKIEKIIANQKNNYIKNHPIEGKDYWGIVNEGADIFKEIKNGDKLGK